MLIVKRMGEELALIRAMRTIRRENRLGHEAGDVPEARSRAGVPYLSSTRVTGTFFEDLGAFSVRSKWTGSAQRNVMNGLCHE